MTLTLQTCEAVIKHALGERSDGFLSTDFLVNETGRYLVTCHEWQYLIRRGTLDLVAGQGYVELPNLLKILPGTIWPSSNTYNFLWTSLGEIVSIQTSGSGGPTGGGYMGAIEWTQAAVDEAPKPRIVITPTVTATQLAYFTYYGRIGWDDVTSAASVIPVPWWAERLFLDLLRAVALGWYEEEQGSIADRLAAVQTGAIFRAAALADGMQNEYGRLVGAAEQLDTYGVIPIELPTGP